MPAHQGVLTGSKGALKYKGTNIIEHHHAPGPVLGVRLGPELQEFHWWVPERGISDFIYTFPGFCGRQNQDTLKLGFMGEGVSNVPKIIC